MVQDVCAVGGLADCGGRERQEVLGVVLDREIPGLDHERGQQVSSVIGDPALLVLVFHEPQRHLVGGVRFRFGTGVDVQQEQVDRVGSDVQD